MATLVIQLARFGDIFQTVPALNALRRKSPEEQIHILVRERFKAAAEAGCPAGVTIHALPTAAILEPVFGAGADGVDEGVIRLNAFVTALPGFTKVINLSFSPFSSYLTEALSGDTTAVSGYTRHSDGYLRIPDDSSAYFYAQAGIGRHNRYHVTEVFAAVAGVELGEADFVVPNPAQTKNNSIVIHLGASQTSKAFAPEKWREVLNALSSKSGPLILVGSQDERAMAETVAQGFDPSSVDNRVGRSSIHDLVRWVGEARLVIGADSAPVHIAALTATPVLNLSCSAVNFWETGPLSGGSRILLAPEPAQVARETLSMLNQEESQAFAAREGLFSGYKLQTTGDDFFWPLLQALYTAADYPKLPAGVSALGFQRLFDIAELAVSQLQKMKSDRQDSTAAAILVSVDEMLTQLPQLDAHVAPVVAWFQTERLRMGPGQPEKILARTLELFEQLGWIAAVYHRPGTAEELRERAVELSGVCAPAFREFKAGEVNGPFQELLSVLQDLSRHTTKVGSEDWSSVLKRLTQALEQGDWIEVADTLTETSGQDVIL